MFSGLNMRRTGVAIVSIAGLSVLYAAMLLFAVCCCILRLDPKWKSRRFTTT